MIANDLINEISLNFKQEIPILSFLDIFLKVYHSVGVWQHQKMALQKIFKEKSAFRKYFMVIRRNLVLLEFHI